MWVEKFFALAVAAAARNHCCAICSDIDGLTNRAEGLR